MGSSGLYAWIETWQPLPNTQHFYYMLGEEGSGQLILEGNLMKRGVHAVFWSKGTVGRASFMAAFLVKRSTVIQAS